MINGIQMGPTKKAFPSAWNSYVIYNSFVWCYKSEEFEGGYYLDQLMGAIAFGLSTGLALGMFDGVHDEW